MNNFKTFSGLIEFYDFSIQGNFIGYFTGNYKDVNGKQYPIFVTEDGVMYLFSRHSLILDFCDQVPKNTLTRITQLSKMKMKSGGTFQNYQIEIESHDEEEESKK